jgi:hypothetical protein
MTFTDHLKFSIVGFSAHRVAYVLAILSFGFVPGHFYVSCETSSAIAGIGMILLIGSLVLSFVTPRGTPHRLRPIALAFIAVIAHTLCTH